MDIEKEVILKKYTGKNEHHKDKTPDLFTCFLIYDAMEEYARLYHEEKVKESIISNYIPKVYVGDDVCNH